ncbi:AbrB/MazE/SpoVT family DNA-binding domain-containing protein [Terrisporobacter glycolicus]|nr:AbrB/MazE/SpoVT family DNA-binding domain-containing protein [Terrisporobacter glycolicus]
MEVRKRKVNITKVGGNASENSKRASVGLPMPWLTEMGVDVDNRDIKLTFKDNKIIIEKE